MSEKIKLLEVYWGIEEGEAQVKFVKDFDDYDWTVKADSLVDISYEINQKYLSILSR